MNLTTGKLVRDDLPLKIAKDYAEVIVKKLSGWDAHQALVDKLAEEIDELAEAIEEQDYESIAEEIADCIAVLYGIASVHDVTRTEIKNKYDKKFESSGDFTEMYWVRAFGEKTTTNP